MIEFYKSFQLKIKDFINKYKLKILEKNEINIPDLYRYLLLVKFNKLPYFYLKEDLKMNDFSDFLLYSTNIKKLILKEERFNYTDRDFKSIFNVLSKILKNKNINSLQFDRGFFHNYGDYRGKSFVALLSENPTITKVILQNQKFTLNNANFDILMDAFSKNNSIKELQFINCLLEDDSMLPTLTEMLKNNFNLENLVFNGQIGVGHSLLKSYHYNKLQEAFQTNQTVKSITFRPYLYKKEDFVSFEKMILTLKNLQSLKLPDFLNRYNYSLEKSVNLLEAFVKNLRNLRHLDISSHMIFKNLETTKKLVDILKTSNINSLDLSRSFN